VSEAKKKSNSYLAVLSLIGLAIFITAFFIGYWVSSSGSIGERASLGKGKLIENCIKDRLSLISQSETNLELVRQLQDMCSKQWHEELMLDDFTLRRIKFLEQSRDGHVLLWVVVAITLSGVILASIQLAAAYQIALKTNLSPSTDGEIAMEGGKVSLKSSIIGLFILLISLGFFSIFVSNVYTITEVGDKDQKANFEEAKQISSAELPRPTTNSTQK
jgi:hypothetical protein